MQRYRAYYLFAVLGALAVVSIALSGAPLLAATPSPSFTIAATNVTMSSNFATGTGSTSFTLTSVNDYAGNVGIICGGPTVPAGVTVPVCNLGGPAILTVEVLTANQTATGTVVLLNTRPPCSPCPVSLPHPASHKLVTGLALAGALLFGFGFRRSKQRWLVLTFLAVGSLAGLAGIGACGGNKSVVTPGTYVYTVSAVDMTTSATVNTSINVTVP